MFSKFTINSVVFLGLTGFTVAVAFYFRNPLLVYTAICFVTVNIALYMWAQYSVHGVEIKRVLPHLAVATHEIQVTIQLTNKRPFARYGILGFDTHSGVGGGKDSTPVAFLSAPKLQAVESSYSLVPLRRGQFTMGPFFLYGGDPFGFYKCWRKFEMHSKLTVLPCPVDFRFLSPPSTSYLAQDQMETVPVSGNSTEFLGVREYVQGEPFKRIHWPTSARTGKLISRLFELNVASSISTLLVADEGMLAGSHAETPLEYAVTMVASLANATARDRFHFTHLALSGDFATSHKGTGKQFYQELAISLAAFKGGEPINWDKGNKAILNYFPQGSSVIAFVPEVGGEMAERLNRIALHFCCLTVITFDRRSFERRRMPEMPGPKISMGQNFLVYTLSYGDNLSHALTVILGSQPAERRLA